MAHAYAHIDTSLLTLFEPQVEQLGMEPRPVRSGVIATDSPLCSGGVWAAPAGPDCLLIYNNVRLNNPLSMVEYPRSCLCICSGTASSIAQTPPRAHSRHMLPTGNLAAFVRGSALERYDLQAHQSYSMCTLSFLPNFFENGLITDSLDSALQCAQKRRSRHANEGFTLLAERLSALDPESLPQDLDAAFHHLNAARADDAGTLLRVRAAALEVAAILIDHVAQASSAGLRRGSREQRLLVERACSAIEKSLSKSISLDELARMLYVGRTHLCEAFHAETGESIGRYTRRLRLERACEILATSDCPIAQVAQNVGYRNQGSFTEAFRAKTGMTPSAWRSAQR